MMFICMTKKDFATINVYQTDNVQEFLNKNE